MVSTRTVAIVLLVIFVLSIASTSYAAALSGKKITKKIKDAWGNRQATSNTMKEVTDKAKSGDPLSNWIIMSLLLAAVCGIGAAVNKKNPLMGVGLGILVALAAALAGTTIVQPQYVHLQNAVMWLVGLGGTLAVLNWLGVGIGTILDIVTKNWKGILITAIIVYIIYGIYSEGIRFPFTLLTQVVGGVVQVIQAIRGIFA